MRVAKESDAVRALQDAIERSGLTDRALARRAGVAFSTVNRTMADLTIPTLRTTMKLATALKLRIEVLPDGALRLSETRETVAAPMRRSMLRLAYR